MDNINNDNADLKVNKRISFKDIITCSKEMLNVLDVAKKISQSEISVLLIGESGVGKELIARAIHNASFKKDGPFVVVNCAGIPDTLVESELFGHEKGAYTDAVTKKKGKFELANEGTLFLDEIGDLSLIAQPKTLRAVEEKRIEHLGSESSIPVNCRIIAATNKDLLKEVKEGRFREDLYYRLCEIRLDVPPLRERITDVPLLVNSFIKEFNQQLDRNVKGASNVVLSYLMRYNWPGNIRELRNIVKRGMSLIGHDTIWLEDLPFKIELKSEDLSSLPKEDFALEVVERNHIRRVLHYSKGSKARAAQLLKISRPTLDRKIKKYNLEK